MSRSKDGRPNLFLRGGRADGTTETLSADEQRLAELGYKQELHRGWSGFSNFAISFSIICVLAGCFTTYGQAFKNGGPIAISIAWPLISVLILFVAFSMSELASAMPTAGGIYYWASKLGGAGWGWFTGWFNLIGLVAVVASVDYVARDVPDDPARPVQRQLHLQLQRATNVHYSAHVMFALFAIILIIHGLINVFSSHLVSLFNSVSVWWNVVGVAVIVVHPDRRAQPPREPSYVFGTRPTNRASADSMFWFYVLPLGFLLTMYTITGYDASAHVSEETHGADDVRAEGRLALGVLLGGRRLDRAAGDHVRDAEAARNRDLQSRLPGARDLHDRAELVRGEGRDPDLDRRPAVLRDGVRHERLADDVRVLARRRRPRPQPVAPARLEPDAHVGRAVRVVFALIITIPAYFPNHLGTPVAFLAVTSISVIGLYIAYTIPVYLRWRMGDSFKTGPWTLGSKYKWVNPIAFVWVAICVVDLLPAVHPSRRALGKRLQLVGGQLRAAGDDRGDARRDDLVRGSAKNTFKGPVRTIDD